jgi:PatG Domain
MSSEQSASANVSPAECSCTQNSGCSCAAGKACECNSKNQPLQKIYALGTIGYDLVSESRKDSLASEMDAGANNPAATADLIAHLLDKPYEAESIIWTLNLDMTPIYAIQPAGGFSETAYERLFEFLDEQQHVSARNSEERASDEIVSIVALAGLVCGKVRLSSGQIIPVVDPEIRGLKSWNAPALVRAAIGNPPEGDEGALTAYNSAVFVLNDLNSRIYYEHRNLGLLGQG